MLLEILVGEDETAEVGAKLAVIGAAGRRSGRRAGPGRPGPGARRRPRPRLRLRPPAPAPAAPAPAPVAAAPAPAAPAPAPGRSGPGSAPAPAAPGRRPPTRGAYVTPLVRKLAAENGVDLAAVKGTGVGGRIRKQDVIAAAEAAKAAAAGSGRRRPAPPPRRRPRRSRPSPLRGQTVKMPRMRKVIGDNMMKALHTQAQLTSRGRGGHHPAHAAARPGEGLLRAPARASSSPRCRSSSRPRPRR